MAMIKYHGDLTKTLEDDEVTVLPIDTRKNVASFEIIMLAVYRPFSWFLHKQRNRFLIKFGVFYNKNKILTILFVVKYEKTTI